MSPCFYCEREFGAFNYFPTENYLICTECEPKMADLLKELLKYFPSEKIKKILYHGKVVHTTKGV